MMMMMLMHRMFSITMARVNKSQTLARSRQASGACWQNCKEN
jgi:hypothetical protein